MKITSETLYCVKVLNDNGIDSSNFDDVVKLLDKFDVSEYAVVKVPRDKFYTELAKRMRELWPPGDKDGKYAWRDSVPNLTKRLELLWKYRKLKDYSVDECLSAARRYLAMFETNVKYMQTLKYFIMKQKSIVDPDDGRITYIQESKLADILEGKSDQDAVQNEWESMLESASAGEGELV